MPVSYLHPAPRTYGAMPLAATWRGFSLACLAGMVLPLLWVLIFSGKINLPQGSLDPIRWHAHEMFFGFGWAVLGGFLLIRKPVLDGDLHLAPLPRLFHSCHRWPLLQHSLLLQ